MQGQTMINSNFMSGFIYNNLRFSYSFPQFVVYFHDNEVSWKSCKQQHNAFFSSKWLLFPRVCKEICVKWGFPELDLFASRACHQIPSYLSWKADPHSLTIDAFQQSRKHRGLLYAFPAFSVIGKVLLKVKTEEVNVILITPNWPAQPWYSQVLELSVTKPLLLPHLSNILVNS